MKKFDEFIKMHIYMKQYILISLFVLCLFSCSEDEIKPYHGQQYLYFSELIGSDDEAINVSFNNYPLDEELTVKIALSLIGKPFSAPAPYKVSVVSDKTTALPENYALPSNPQFKPNVAKDELELKLIKTDKLKEDVALLLKIEKNDYFVGSMQQYDTIRIVFNNVESQPLWWDKDVERIYLGKYSREKYVALLKYGGEEAIGFGELNSAQKRQYALRLKEAIVREGLTEKDGKPMTVPIY